MGVALIPCANQTRLRLFRVNYFLSSLWGCCGRYGQGEGNWLVVGCDQPAHSNTKIEWNMPFKDGLCDKAVNCYICGYFYHTLIYFCCFLIPDPISLPSPIFSSHNFFFQVCFICTSFSSWNLERRLNHFHYLSTQINKKIYSSF